MLTVGAAAKKFGISRTTLLYYERIGLICPAKRAENGYRLYSDDDLGRLNAIMDLREAGIPLADIQKHIDYKETDVSSLLLKRLNELNSQIQTIKDQQAVIITLLSRGDLKTKRLNRQMWKKILLEAGIDNATTIKWHQSFEKQSPLAHTALLRTLGFSDEEISRFREEYAQS